MGAANRKGPSRTASRIGIDPTEWNDRHSEKETEGEKRTYDRYPVDWRMVTAFWRLHLKVKFRSFVCSSSVVYKLQINLSQ